MLVGGHGFASSSEPVLRFGLPGSFGGGDPDSPVDITVLWPNGGLSEIHGVSVNRVLPVIEASDGEVAEQ